MNDLIRQMEPPSYSQEEFIILEEQNVTYLPYGNEKKRSGALVLTNRRLAFVQATEYDRISVQRWEQGRLGKLIIDPDNFATNYLHSLVSITHIYDASEIPDHLPSTISIPIGEMFKVEGKNSFLKTAKLTVAWMRNDAERVTGIFREIADDQAKRILGYPSINGWAPIIERIKGETQKFILPQNLPSKYTLEGKIYYLLGDMQEKGVFEIMRELREKFDLELAEGEIKSACFKLAGERLVEYHREEGSSYDIMLETFRKYTPIELNLTE